jgi:hypothetical protein
MAKDTNFSYVTLIVKVGDNETLMCDLQFVLILPHFVFLSTSFSDFRATPGGRDNSVSPLPQLLAP